MKTNPSQAGQQLRQDIELLRTVCSFGIVWFHAQAMPGHAFAHSALLVFLCLSSYLPDYQKGTFFTRLKSRGERLLLPWITWFSLYAIIYFYNRHELLKQGVHPFNWVLSGGASIHLWYLPFAFLALTVIDASELSFGKRPLLVFCGSVSLLLITTSNSWSPWIIETSQPWQQYAFSICAVLLGPIFKALSATERKRHTALVGICMSAFSWIYMPEALQVQYTTCIVVMTVIATNTLRSVPASFFSSLGGYTFSTYLSHIFFLRLAVRLHVDHLGFSATVAWLMSMLAAAMIAKLIPSRPRRWLG